MHRVHPRGVTILELMLALMVVSIVTAITVPTAARFLDAIEVRGAANDVEALLNAARHLAIARADRATLDIDTAARTLVLHAGSDTVRRCNEGSLHGVSISASRSSATYSPVGIGFGVTNLTLMIRKGAVAETLYVSRLGRVRH